MPLLVQLACRHNLWPGGDRALYTVGDTASCRTRREITRVEVTSW